MSKDPIILAYSGGLDTSFCVPWLKETYGRDVITATVDTGGIEILPPNVEKGLRPISSLNGA